MYQQYLKFQEYEKGIKFLLFLKAQHFTDVGVSSSEYGATIYKKMYSISSPKI